MESVTSVDVSDCERMSSPMLL